MAIRFRQFVKNHRKAIGSGLVLFICAVVLVPQAVEAQWYKDVLDGFIMGVAWLVFFIAWLGGQLLVTLITILVWVASYNNFINEPIVSVGWTIIRDLCNMAFIIALLYMAFNMVFGIKKGGNLLTLIINAGLINFSKVISGFVIDISQVVMLTFVNGFYKIAGGNILEGLGFTKMFEMVKLGGTGGIDPNAIPGGDGPAGAGTVLISIVFALILIYIAVGMVLTFIIMLIGRIFKLWGLLITSPVPFVKKILPGMPDVGGGGNYWGELAKTAAAGPILAFWLWLIFTSVSLYNRVYVNTGFTGSFGDSPAGSPESLIQGGGGGVGWSQAGTLTNIMSYIIFIGLMMLALQQAQSQANAMHSIVGNAAKKLRGGAHKLTMKGSKWLGRQGAEVTGVATLGRRAVAAKNLFMERSPRLKEFLTKKGREERLERKQAEAKGYVYSKHAKHILKKPELAQRYETTFTTQSLLRQSDSAIKDLKDSGSLDNADDSKFQFEEALRNNDKKKALGVAMHMAGKGWGVPDQMGKQIREKFGISEGSELDLKLRDQLEDRAGKSEGYNKFRSRAASAVRKDQITGKLSLATVDERIGDADEDIQRGNFHEVDDAFKGDKKFWDFSNIAENKDEIRVRIGNVASWAKKVRSSARLLRNPKDANDWLRRWGSKSVREKMVNQISQLVGIAKQKGITLSDDQNKDIEALTRLFNTSDEAFTYQAHPKAKNSYNLEAIISSVDSSVPVQLSAQKFDNSGKVIKGTEIPVEVKEAIFQNTSIGSLTVAADEQTKKFTASVLGKEEVAKRTASDIAINQNEAVAQDILEEKARLDAVQRGRIQAAKTTVERLKSELTKDGTRSKEELTRMEAELNAATKNLNDVFDDTILTDVVDQASGMQKNEKQVFTDSHLNSRLVQMKHELEKKIREQSRLDPITTEVGKSHIEDTVRNAALAAGHAGPDADNAGATASSAFSTALGAGHDRKRATAAGVAAGKTYNSSLSTLNPLVYSHADIERFANAASSSGLTYSKERDAGKRGRELALEVARDVATKAGFTLPASFETDVKRVYNTARASGVNEFDAISEGVREGVRVSAINSGILTPDAGEIASNIREGFADYNTEIRNHSVVDTISNAADVVDTTYTHDYESTYNAQIAGGATHAAAQVAARATAEANAIAVGTALGGVTTGALMAGAVKARDEFATADASLDKKGKSSFDSAARGVAVDTNRAVGTRRKRFIRTEANVPQEKEHLLNRRLLEAQGFINQSLSHLGAARNTQSLEERVQNLTDARQMFASARDGLWVKYGEDPAFRTEYNRVLSDLIVYGDFSNPAHRNEAEIGKMEKSIQRVLNYYVK